MIEHPRMASVDALFFAVTAIAGTIVASDCPVCRRPVGGHDHGVCDHCWGEIQELDLGWPGGRQVTSLTVLGAYEGRLGAIIRRLKFGQEEGLGTPLGERLGARLLARPRSIDQVVPVPLHWRRRWSRGYNQSERIAARIARALGRPVNRRVLVRARATATQTGRTRRERVVNVRGAFVVNGRLQRGSSVLLVDDVVTTGATIRECARVLKGAGAGDVHVAAAARALVRLGG